MTRPRPQTLSERLSQAKGMTPLQQLEYRVQRDLNAAIYAPEPGPYSWTVRLSDWPSYRSLDYVLLRAFGAIHGPAVAP